LKTTLLSTDRRKSNVLFLWLVIALLASPLFIYATKFGSTISSDHQRWGEFGSAIAGIYSPILAIATLVVLLSQYKLQHDTHRHATDQAFVQVARADIEFYLQRLSAAVDSNGLSGRTARHVLLHQFRPQSLGELLQPNVHLIAKELDGDVPHLLTLFHATWMILNALSQSKSIEYRIALTSSLNKVMALLGQEACVSLENFQRARVGDHPELNYFYSPLLRKHEA
jgi:hypothetical protein